MKIAKSVMAGVQSGMNLAPNQACTPYAAGESFLNCRKCCESPNKDIIVVPGFLPNCTEMK